MMLHKAVRYAQLRKSVHRNVRFGSTQPGSIADLDVERSARLLSPEQRTSLGYEMLWKKPAIGRGLLAAFSPAECFQQLVQEHCLAFQDLKSRLGNAEPGRAIDFGK